MILSRRSKRDCCYCLKREAGIVIDRMDFGTSLDRESETLSLVFAAKFLMDLSVADSLSSGAALD